MPDPDHDDGRVYSLGSGGEIDVRTGVYARVEGLEADVSYFQQGTPVDVGLFRVVEPREGARLQRDYVLGSWSARRGLPPA